MAIHRAKPADGRLSESTCLVCGDTVHPAQGGHGMTWVHSDGAVASNLPPIDDDIPAGPSPYPSDYA
jgi:hypothetical protein